MATTVIHSRIKNKVNPSSSLVLLDGEFAAVRANGKTLLKVGDGSTAVSALSYVEAPWDDISSWVD